MIAPDADLARFVVAQEDVYARALAEVRAGAKRSHWMWFVFPQLRGLGRSAMAWDFGLDGRCEAEAYLAHPLLGARLREITAAALPHAPRGANALFGSPDDMKFHACVTLFDAVLPEEVFGEALGAFFGRRRHEGTLGVIARPSD